MWRLLFPFIKLNNQLSTYYLNKQSINLIVPYQSADFGNCGIACVYMTLKHKQKIEESFKVFTSKHKNSNNYQEAIGWKHDSLINILRDKHINAIKTKYKSTRDLINILLQTKRPVITSVFVPSPSNLSIENLFQKRNTSENLEKHLVIVKGLSGNNIIVHDPRNLFQYSKDLHIPLNIFNKIFTGNYIYTHE